VNIKVNLEPFHYIEVKDLYTQKEQDKILKELTHHESKGIFKTPDNTRSATEDGEFLKQNTGFWWDALYYDRGYSDILKINRKLFKVLESKKAEESWFFNQLYINRDTTLISYYENKDYYKPHRDNSLLTVLTWFYKEPKMFTGGELVFTDYDIKVKCAKNYTIIFPSNIKHEVTEINLPKEHCGNGNGRFVMTQFLMQQPTNE